MKLELYFRNNDECSNTKFEAYSFCVYNEHFNREIYGHVDDELDIVKLCRYICYKLGTDELDRTLFVNSFKTTLAKICSKLNSRGIETNEVKVYGEITKENLLFTPKHYEYLEYVPTKRIGNIDNKTKLSPNKNIKCEINKINITGQVVLTDGVLLDKGHIREYPLVKGHYNLYKIYDDNNILVSVCLVAGFYSDFYSIAYWEDCELFAKSKKEDTCWILCEKDYTPSEKDINVEDVVVSSKCISIPVKLQSDNEKDSKYASHYIARNSQGIIGIAFDTVGYKAGERINLNTRI